MMSKLSDFLPPEDPAILRLRLERLMLSLKAVRIECLDESDIAVATATGFIRREAQRHFLYTCWHVVTGYDMHGVEVARDLPARRTLRVTLQGADTRQPGVVAIGGSQAIRLPLYRNQRPPFIPAWHQDKADAPHIDLNAIGIRVPFWHDVVKLELPSDLIVADQQVILEDHFWEHALISPTSTVFIVGYPFGYSTHGLKQPTPVVLTRSIAASDLGDRRTERLLDGAGAPAMSGGPVFFEKESRLALLGIYTGAIYPDRPFGGADTATSLGTFCDLSLIWSTLPLVPCSTELAD